jgi:hypothetical protein
MLPQGVESIFAFLTPFELFSLLQQFSHGLRNLGEVWNEVSIIPGQSQKTLNLVDSCWWLPIHHLLQFLWINNYSFLRDSVTQEFDFLQAKISLGQFGIKAVLSQALEYHVQVFGVLCFILRVDQNIIDQDHHEFVQFGHED